MNKKRGKKFETSYTNMTKVFNALTDKNIIANTITEYAEYLSIDVFENAYSQNSMHRLLLSLYHGDLEEGWKDVPKYEGSITTIKKVFNKKATTSEYENLGKLIAKYTDENCFIHFDDIGFKSELPKYMHLFRRGK